MEMILAVLALLFARTEEDFRTLQKSEWFRRARIGGVNGADLADAAVRFGELARTGAFRALAAEGAGGEGAAALAKLLGVPPELLTLLRGVDLGALFPRGGNAPQKGGAAENPLAPIAFADAEIVAALNRYFS